MFPLYVIATALSVIAIALYAFSRSRDAMQPAVFISPLFLYFYGIWPLMIHRPGGLLDYFTVQELDYVGLLYLLSILAFFLGMANWPRGIHRRDFVGQARGAIFSLHLNARVRRRLLYVGLLLGAVAIAAYWYSIVNVGGFVDAYSRAKGGGRTFSGYIGEAPLLAYPAIVLIALSRQRLKIRLVDIFLVLLVASPHLIQGTFGGRRGPLFLILAMLFLSWYLARGTLPSLRKGVIGVSIISLVVVVVWSQRQHLYLGSGEEFEVERLVDRLAPDTISTGDEYLAGVATVLTADEIENFYWGYRYFVTLFIRPIPRQIWPTKYEDVGADWLYQYGDEEREERYLHAVGFTLLSGSSTGFVADVYYEFAWLTVLVCYLLGLALFRVWRWHRNEGGLATVFFIEALILSIYLPTQSLTAFLHRLLFMAGFTWLVWRYWLAPALENRRSRRRPGQSLGRPNGELELSGRDRSTRWS